MLQPQPQPQPQSQPVQPDEALDWRGLSFDSIFVGVAVVVVWKLTRCCHAVWLRLLLFSASSSAVFAADPLSALLRVLSPPFGKQTETGTPTATLGLATALGT